MARVSEEQPAEPSPTGLTVQLDPSGHDIMMSPCPTAPGQCPLTELPSFTPLSEGP